MICYPTVPFIMMKRSSEPEYSVSVTSVSESSVSESSVSVSSVSESSEPESSVAWVQNRKSGQRPPIWQIDQGTLFPQINHVRFFEISDKKVA